ncbi:MAG: hypothetical protein SGPRY_009356 [Prymnesium sp.]
MNRSFLVQKEPQTDWSRRFSEQFLTRKLCRDTIRQYERETGVKYDVYARLRLDTLLLEPFPFYFLQHVFERQLYHGLRKDLPSLREAQAGHKSMLSPKHQIGSEFGALSADAWVELTSRKAELWAYANQYGVGTGKVGAPTTVEPRSVRGVSAVPLGEDYGLEWPLGLMDKMMIGDDHAFESDSSVWRSIASSSLDSNDLWLMEGLNRDHNLLAGIEVRRLPLSYLILKSDQSAKYPSELHHALKRNPLLLRSSPELCGDTGKWSCRTCPMCGIMPESTRQEDPGFCSLIATCNRTYTTELRLAHRMARDPRCTEDGTVYMKGQWVEGTARCLFDTLSERLATIDIDSVGLASDKESCPAADVLSELASGKLNKSHVELVVSSYDADLQWTKPWHNLRTVYRKAPTPQSQGCELRQSNVVKLPNHGRESHSYLYHIVNNYDRLADRTVFMQDREPTCGFFLASGELGDHLMMNVSLFDYINPSNGETFMPLTMRFDANLTTCSLRSTFADLGDKQLQHTDRPVPQAPPPESSTDFWLPWERNDFQEWIYKISAKTVNGTSRQLPADEPLISFGEFFQHVFSRPPPTIVYFSQGGQFAASRDAIRRTPRDRYEWVMRQIERGHEELVYYCEATWFYFVHPRAHPDLTLQQTPLPPPQSEQAHFLSHLPKKVILSKMLLHNVSLEVNTSNRTWMSSLSGKADLSSSWSAAYFQRLATSFMQHSSRHTSEQLVEPDLNGRIEDGRLFEAQVNSKLRTLERGGDEITALKVSATIADLVKSSDYWHPKRRKTAGQQRVLQPDA